MTPSSPGLRRPPAPRPSSSNVTRLVPDRALPGTVGTADVQGTLALDLGRTTVPAPEQPRLFAVPAPAEPDQGHEEVRVWAARFAQAVVEVTGGDRPLNQLLRWTSPRVYAELGRRVRILAQARPVGAHRRTVRAQLRSVHVFLPVPGAAEVSVHVRHGQRSRAIAARLEHRDGRWTCTDLRIG